ncbi:MAG: hypothetical protein ACPL3C_04905 [Pyrobaculum sp.]
MQSRFMSRPLRHVDARGSYWDFEKSLTALYVMNASRSPPAVELDNMWTWHGFGEVHEIPEELKTVAKKFIELRAWRYLDLAVVKDGVTYRVISESHMAKIGATFKTPGRLALVPVVSALRSYYAEGERGLITGVVLAGLLLGLADASGGWERVLSPHIELPKTLVVPAYLWRS